jgi:hypothetical protein
LIANADIGDREEYRIDQDKGYQIAVSVSWPRFLFSVFFYKKKEGIGDGAGRGDVALTSTNTTTWLRNTTSHSQFSMDGVSCWIDPNGRPTARDSVSGGPLDPAP